MNLPLLALFLAPTNPLAKTVSVYLYQIFHKNPFRGIYQPNAFDLSILIPYFTILIILSIYGMHRYCLDLSLLEEPRQSAEARRSISKKLPRVTIQLPIYNERYVVERLLETVTRHRLSRATCWKFSFWMIRRMRRAWSARAWSANTPAPVTPSRIITATNREGFKAGALAKGMKSATGEFIAIFDADFAPPPEIVHQMIHYFADPRWAWCRAAGRGSIANTRS